MGIAEGFIEAKSEDQVSKLGNIHDTGLINVWHRIN
jgi:hypothetical protein